jgi:uncharacterized SAM-dependent methyltransferase
MNYFKNIELAEIYKVSPNTIGNWIEASKEGKLNLQLHDEGSRCYILNSPTNHILLKQLSEKGKKFKNTRSLKVIEPSEELYSIFEEEKIIDMITNIETNKELDLKFGYFREGAKSFDQYVIKSFDELAPSTPTSTNQLIINNDSYIYSLIKEYDNVNIVDIGPGNAVTIKPLIDMIKDKNLLGKYIALDYSADMMSYAEVNLKTWYGKDFPYESHVKDINYDRFQDLLFKNTKFSGDKIRTTNIIAYLGGTLQNQRDYKQSLKVIKSSMGPHDIFILNQRLDTEKAKLSLSFKPKDDAHTKKDLEVIFFVLELLSIKEEYYEVERIFNNKTRCREIAIRLKYDLKVKFKFSNKTLNLQQKDRILLWRSRHYNFIEVIDKLGSVGFDVIHASTSPDLDYNLVISKLKYKAQ